VQLPTREEMLANADAEIDRAYAALEDADAEIDRAYAALEDADAEIDRAYAALEEAGAWLRSDGPPPVPCSLTSRPSAATCCARRSRGPRPPSTTAGTTDQQGTGRDHPNWPRPAQPIITRPRTEE
jgi:hypothetical protein